MMMAMDATNPASQIQSIFIVALQLSLQTFSSSFFANFLMIADDLTAQGLQIALERILKNLYWHAYISPLFDRAALTS
jgi:hypothetical protein